MRTIDTKAEERIETLRQNRYFDDLPENLLKQIAEQMHLREFPRGDILFLEGDPASGMYIMETGSAKIFRTSPQGRQYIVRILQEGDTFAEVPAFDGGMHPVNVEALETCRAWEVDAATLRQLINLNPTFAHKLIRNYSQMLRGMVRMVSEMAFYQVTHRLARLIDEMPRDRSAPHWTQEQLAARLGTVREVVARSLKELERSGAIKIEDRRIQIIDRDLFQQWLHPN